MDVRDGTGLGCVLGIAEGRVEGIIALGVIVVIVG